MIKRPKIIAIIIGFFLSIGLLVFGYQIFSRVFTRASDVEPRDVVISEIGKNSAKISWTSGIETQGVVEYGTTPTALNFFAPETKESKSHEIELTLLSPNTTYYFQIRVADKKYDNGGVPWTFTTKSINDSTVVSPTSVLISPTPALKPSDITPTLKSNPKLEGSTEIEVPATSKSQGCNETDCQKIKEKLGQGCTAKDYILCVLKLTTTPTMSPTPITN